MRSNDGRFQMPIMIGVVSELSPITAMMIADSQALSNVGPSLSAIDPFSSIDFGQSVGIVNLLRAWIFKSFHAMVENGRR